ncbi:two-component system response regulator TorR [Roseovarius aestuarii]|uniref:Regulatory protein VirG n=1 Tax=Roseovarius aestuarii TaxID=475083 RepID=A0A1X7BT18_9RHOB|nr:two-component system response regulator TorR [Roseovarius aestuarii]SMC12359.1 TorCAD operon transcriptional regulatory protein TorR [Roseovarius aestuarii]
MSERSHIIVVEDEPVTRMTLTSYFEAQGYRTSEAEDSSGLDDILQSDPADLLIVDINLSGKDGLEITRELRAVSEVGIILVSARSDDVDRIVGLELGADDYVVKPFNKRELLARVKNLLRRTRAARQLTRSVRSFDGFQLDLSSRWLTSRDGKLVPLTRAEFELLAILTTHPGQVLTRERLMQGVTHRSDGGNERTVDVLVRRLRAKLERDPRSPQIISTAHGEGYIFTAALE